MGMRGKNDWMEDRTIGLPAMQGTSGQGLLGGKAYLLTTSPLFGQHFSGGRVLTVSQNFLGDIILMD